MMKMETLITGNQAIGFTDNLLLCDARKQKNYEIILEKGQ